jgi:hypothetical protein
LLSAVKREEDPLEVDHPIIGFHSSRKSVPTDVNEIGATYDPVGCDDRAGLTEIGRVRCY